MDRSFLSDVKFDKDIKLKDYKKLNSPQKSNKIKLIFIKLFYFIVVKSIERENQGLEDFT